MSDRVATTVEPKTSRPVAGAPARPALTPARSARLQRACACGEGTAGACKECDKEKQKHVLQRQSNGGAEPASVPPVVGQVLNSPGRPLDGSTRTFMESRFGHDFGGVRVHDDSLAAESARAVNARAYTVGQDIAFGPGQYQPHTTEGMGLLAHELAHTVQQDGLQRSADTSLGISSENDASEREASNAAAAVVLGEKPVVGRSGASSLLHRTPWGTCPAGTRLSGLPESVNKSAELKIVEYYENVVPNKANVISNRNPIENFLAQPPPGQARMIQAMSELFRATKPSIIKTLASVAPGEVDVVDPDTEEDASGDESAMAHIEGREPDFVEPPGEFKRPDIADLESREVYDVTTIGAADGKVAKIATDYVEKLERLRKSFNAGGKSWTAGRQLAAPAEPRIMVYKYQDNNAICYGLTDFTLRPGVIAYEAIELPPGAVATVATTPYVIQTKTGTTATIDANPAPSSTDLLNTGPNNLAAAQIIPGLVMKTLKRGKTPQQDRIKACVVSEGCVGFDGKPPIPITIKSGQGEIELKIDNATRILSMGANYKGVKFTSKHLSEGTLTKLDIEGETGIAGAGKLKPSLPILRGTEFGIEFSKESYKITAGLEEATLKKALKPLPWAKLKKVALELELYPEFKPSGVIELEVAAGEKKLLDAAIKITRSASGGLLATGTLNAYIPGVDKADGEIRYEDGQWSGFAKAETSQIKLPYVTGGRVEAGFNEKGPYGQGTVNLEIPGGHTADVSLNYKNQKWFFSGKGVFKIPRLDTDVTLVISRFDGEMLKGQGTVKNFNFKGLTGDLVVNYEGKVGAPKPRIWGDGTLKFKKPKDKPKATGDLTIHLLENGKFSGEGNISYEIKPGLVAAAGIKIDQNGKVTVIGSLKFPPYQLFKKFPDPAKRLTIFEIPTISIPIPGASIGPIGLQARIDAGIYADYGIGPGEIRDGYVKSSINPLEEDVDLDVEVGGQIYIPAFFRVTGEVSGSVALDIKIASVAGGLTVSVTAALNGHVLSNLKAHYFKGKFEAQADFELVLALALMLALKAFVKAEAGLWRFKVTTTKEWKLAEFKFDTGLKLGMRLKKPLSYSSETGFAAPSFDDIEWILPKFEPEKAVKASFDKDPGVEKEE